MDKHASFFRPASSALKELPPTERGGKYEFLDLALAVPMSWIEVKRKLARSVKVVVINNPIVPELDFNLDTISRICQRDVIDVIG